MHRYAGFGLLALMVLAALFLLRGEEVTPSPPRPQAIPKDRSTPVEKPETGYILALSWSPAFCAQEDPAGKSDQCEVGAGSGLVVHGLWPERSAGKDEFCSTSEPDRLPSDLAARVKTFMPSLGLARHEWEKHGSCSGLTQRGYFAAMERAWRNVKIPSLLVAPKSTRKMRADDLKKALQHENPQLQPQSISLQCGKGGVLREIRLCLTKSLRGTSCPSATGRGCTGSISILPPR